MNDNDKLKLVDTLFMIHETFDIDGITTFEIGHETKVDDLHVKDGFGVIYKLEEHVIPVHVGHPIKTLDELKVFKPPAPVRDDLGLLDLALTILPVFALFAGVLLFIGSFYYKKDLYTWPLADFDKNTSE